MIFLWNHNLTISQYFNISYIPFFTIIGDRPSYTPEAMISNEGNQSDDFPIKSQFSFLMLIYRSASPIIQTPEPPKIVKRGITVILHRKKTENI